jgi:hypothetical protein
MLRRSILAFAALALCLTAPVARAGGINLSWDDCGAFGSAQKNFACDTNVGSNVLVVSARPDDPMQLIAHNAELFIVTDQPTLSNWWQIGNLTTSGCRRSAASMSFDFPGMSGCVDLWQGLAVGGVNVYVPSSLGPNSLRLFCGSAIQVAVPIDTEHEIYLSRIIISNIKTVGFGACQGCTNGACIVLRSVVLQQPSPRIDFTLTNPLVRQYVTWQPGGNSVAGGCPAATPTHASTWGSIKSMYR